MEESALENVEDIEEFVDINRPVGADQSTPFSVHAHTDDIMLFRGIATIAGNSTSTYQTVPDIGDTAQTVDDVTNTAERSPPDPSSSAMESNQASIVRPMGRTARKPR
jgi:hypothetical protein